MAELFHYGMPRRSGRYPYGSGDNPYQHNSDFQKKYRELKKEGYTEKEIAELMGCKSTGELRAKVSIAADEIRKADIKRALELKDKGYSNTKIAEMMDKPESTIRSYLDPTLSARADRTQQIADELEEYVKNNRYVDVGAGTELYLDTTDTRMKTALEILKQRGYQVKNININQMGTDHQTTMKVLVAPDVTTKELYEHKYDISSVASGYIDSDDIPHIGNKPVENVDSSRIYIRYAEDGGSDKDGVIEIRRGVEDLYLGNSRYAQVRVGVDGTHYLKGMAMYGDDIPEGYDIVFNTNKHEGTDKYKVFKEMKNDTDNPFGATYRQKEYIGSDGEKHVSALNIVREEGEWNEWNNSLASQMLSKQYVPVAKRQLQLEYNLRKSEFDDICALTNPAVKRKLLEEYASNCDAASVNLKAAPFPRQATKVILPFPDMKDDEIYDPDLADGERVALIRYPHGGKFEIPVLTNRVKGSPATDTIDRAKDAVGINKKVADILSGADFDGDTVVVIPLSKDTRIDSKTVDPNSPLGKLRSFDPKESYPGYEGMKVMTPKQKQTEMGKVTNLITDMTLQGATDDEIARAVRHSMVVIDAEKHGLNFRQSEIDNRIDELKEKYQNGGGASTIISRASKEIDIPERKENYGKKGIDPETGKKLYSETGATVIRAALKSSETYKNGKPKKGKEVILNTDYKDGRLYYLEENEKTGKKERVYITDDDLYSKKVVAKTQKAPMMETVDDAYSLTSGGSKEHPGRPMEAVYANYANQMKALANAARKELYSTGRLESSPSAKKTYAKEVDSLNAKLNIALKNAPLERKAQLLANYIYEQKIKADPAYYEDSDHKKRARGEALDTARIRVGAKKTRIDISEKEWEAIQAGAISDTKLTQILNNADMDKVRKLATPRYSSGMSTANIALANSMYERGYTQEEIANRLGVSPATVSKNLKNVGYDE